MSAGREPGHRVHSGFKDVVFNSSPTENKVKTQEKYEEKKPLAFGIEINLVVPV